MTHVSLFTGIGGLDLAAEWAGFETVLQVEREPFALQVLEKHWPNVPRITDVREVTLERVQEIMADPNGGGHYRTPQPGVHHAPQKNGTADDFSDGNCSGTDGNDKTGGRTNGFKPGHITVVSGGFPCQPFSAAGKRRGADDDRYLWPELLRIVEELQPSWVIGENVSGLLSIDGGMEIDRMLAALEARDYTPWVLHHPAAGVGAPHKRDRVFIVAHRKDGGIVRRQRLKMDDATDGSEWADRTRGSGADGRGQDVADTESERFGQGRAEPAGQCGELRTTGSRASCGGGSQWAVEPDVGRVATGVPYRVDRLRALGNAVVPQQAYPIFAAIAQTEDM